MRRDRQTATGTPDRVKHGKNALAAFFLAAMLGAR